MAKVLDFMKRNSMLIALLLIMGLFQLLIVLAGKGSLFAPRNITNLIAQNGYLIILATGMLLCILTGGNIDLSVGSMVCLVAAIGGTLIVREKMNIYLAIIICLLAGTAMGALQAFWIAYVRIPAFIVTLAGMLAFRGLALVLLGGQTISPIPKEYSRFFGSFLGGGPDASHKARLAMIVGVFLCLAVVAAEVYGRVSRIRRQYEVAPLGWSILRLAAVCAIILGVFHSFGRDRGIPVVLILIGVIVLAYYYYTSNTVPGRYLYAMGGSEKATRLSGIDTDKVLFFAYTNMGFLASVAALVCLARFNSAFPDLGRSYEMDAIGACYVGGASAYGGVGTIGGTLVGTVFMGVLNNGMSILGLDINWQQTVKGVVLLSAVAFDVLSKNRKR